MSVNFKNELMKRYNRPILIICFLLITNVLSATEEEQVSRFFTGGFVGLQFGTVTLLDVSPLIGYRLTDSWHVGVGGTYKFHSIRNFHYDMYTGRRSNVRSHILGAQTFTRLFVTKQFFAHGEFEFLRIRNEVFVDDPDEQRYNRDYTFSNIHSIFIGGGYRQLMSERFAADIMLLWNLNDTFESPYSNPVFRMGFIINL